MSDRDGHGKLARPRPSRPRFGTAPTYKLESLDLDEDAPLLYYTDLRGALDLSPGAGAVARMVSRLLGSQRVALSELFVPGSEAFRGVGERLRSMSGPTGPDVDRRIPSRLCVAWGVVVWENEGAKIRFAPLLTRQAAVVARPDSFDDFDLSVSGPWRVNVSVLRLLEMDVGVGTGPDWSGEVLEELARRRDPAVFFKRVAGISADVPGLSIVPRLLLLPLPSLATVERQQIVPVRSFDPDAVSSDNAAKLSTDAVALVLAGVLDPGTLPEGSTERREVETFGLEAIVGEITAALRVERWPPELIEHSLSGLQAADPGELLERWYAASPHGANPSGWDATHFGLWGLLGAPRVGTAAIRSVARWRERRRHPILVAWQLVAEHGTRGRHRPRHLPKPASRTGRVFDRRTNSALWVLPVDLLVEWAGWIFRQWPGAPVELVLPAGGPDLARPWHDRARPVAELAVRTWVPFATVDAHIRESVHRWVQDLAGACGGEGAELATWFHDSALRVSGSAHAGASGRVGAPPGERVERSTTPLRPTTG
jgi:hypothetical protein